MEHHTTQVELDGIEEDMICCQTPRRFPSFGEYVVECLFPTQAPEPAIIEAIKFAAVPIFLYWPKFPKISFQYGEIFCEILIGKPIEQRLSDDFQEEMVLSADHCKKADAVISDLYSVLKLHNMCKEVFEKARTSSNIELINFVDISTSFGELFHVVFLWTLGWYGGYLHRKQRQKSHL